jgi:hypothetical protein
VDALDITIAARRKMLHPQQNRQGETDQHCRNDKPQHVLRILLLVLVVAVHAIKNRRSGLWFHHFVLVLFSSVCMLRA